MRVQFKLNSYSSFILRRVESITKNKYSEEDITNLDELMTCISDLLFEYRKLEEKYDNIINN